MRLNEVIVSRFLIVAVAAVSLLGLGIYLSSVPEIPTAFNAYLYDSDDELVTEEEVLEEIEIGGEKPDDVSVYPDEGLVVVKTHKSGDISFDDWDSGLELNYIEGAVVTIDVHNFGGSPHEYNPSAEIVLDGVDGLEAHFVGSDSHHIEGVDYAVGPLGDRGWPLHEQGGYIDEYEWTINGEEMHGEDVSYEFDSEGSYDVELVVTDHNGNTDSVVKSFDIEEDGGGSDSEDEDDGEDDGGDDGEDDGGDDGGDESLDPPKAKEPKWSEMFSKVWDWMSGLF